MDFVSTSTDGRNEAHHQPVDEGKILRATRQSDDSPGESLWRKALTLLSLGEEKPELFTFIMASFVVKEKSRKMAAKPLKEYID